MSSSMNPTQNPVARHYGRGSILESILKALQDLGKDLDHLSPADLTAVDAFHLRGQEATEELAKRSGLSPQNYILDVGSGLGGSVRHLASEYGCQVLGVDLTREYVEAAIDLAKRVGLEEKVKFQEASALALPFPEATFDMAWTEHAQMNIQDKNKFYSEMARVLKPGGRLVFHDIFQGKDQDFQWPVPWAEVPSLSHLISPDALQKILKDLGFQSLDWEDKTEESLTWLRGRLEQIQKSGAPPLGIHLLMGETALQKLENMERNLAKECVAVFQGVWVK